MAYEASHIIRQKLLYNKSTSADNTLTFQLVEDGDKVTPTSATIAITKPGGTEVLAATAMTVSGTLMTYITDTTTVADFPIDEGYRADVAVTSGGVVYNRHFIFDVARYHLRLGITYDQLVAFDDSISGMRHDNDEDFSELIEACRGVLQVRIELHVLGNGKLVENMIIDRTAVAIAARFYILHRIYFNKDSERSDAYEAQFDELWAALMSSIRYDRDQDGEEDGKIGGLQNIRLLS